MILHNERQQIYSSVAFQIIVNTDYFNRYSISDVKVSQSIVQC